MVENEIQTGKEYTSFDCSNSAVQTINQSTATVITDGELKVFWSPVKGADEYDLEWSYIDSSALANYYFAGTSTFNRLKFLITMRQGQVFQMKSIISLYCMIIQEPYFSGFAPFKLKIMASVQGQTGARHIQAAWGSMFLAAMNVN